MRRVALLAVMTVVCAGCADDPKPFNPSFRISYSEADRARADMAAHRKPLERPVVIVTGYLDFFASRGKLARRYLASAGIDDQRVIVVDPTRDDFPQMRQALIDAVDAAFPTDDPAFTTEVDVLGQSIGGLVASYAAAASEDPARPRRLKVKRLFAVGTPFRGAAMAGTWGFTALHKAMAPGSPLTEYVGRAAAPGEYEVVPYVLLGDSIIGEPNAAPPGGTPFWLPTQAPVPHSDSQDDKRIYADIARRLRGEPAYARPPAAALPAETR